MRVGIVQSSYIPWRGYFDFIDAVDLFIILDDVQYTKSDWRNRNRIKTSHGWRWISVPVKRDRLAKLIQDTEINNSTDWRGSHRDLFRSAYAKAPYFAHAMSLLEQGLASSARTISELNVTLMRAICEYLSISTPLRFSAELEAQGAKTDRLVELLTAVQATTYVSGPAAKAYLEVDKLRAKGLALEYKSYDYGPYPQLWGPFEGAVTVLDLIANCGPESRAHLKSASPNEVAA